MQKFIFRTCCGNSHYFATSFDTYMCLCSNFNLSCDSKRNLFDWITKYHSYDDSLAIITTGGMKVGELYTAE